MTPSRRIRTPAILDKGPHRGPRLRLTICTKTLFPNASHRELRGRTSAYLFRGYSSTRNREEQVVSLNFPLGAASIPALAFTCLAYGGLVTLGDPGPHWPGMAEPAKTKLGTVAPSAVQV